MKRIRNKYTKIFYYISQIPIFFWLYIFFISPKFFIKSSIVILLSFLLKKILYQPKPHEYFSYKVPDYDITRGSIISSHSVVSFILFFYYPYPFNIIFLVFPIFRILAYEHWPSNIIFSFIYVLLSQPIFLH